MISAHSMVFMSDFLNLKDNFCYYTDTDSTFLENPLPDKYIGNELGKFSFKGKVLRAYFISPKLYCLIMEDGKIIIKSKGLKYNSLNLKDFITLFKGKSIYVKQKQFFIRLLR